VALAANAALIVGFSLALASRWARCAAAREAMTASRNSSAESSKFGMREIYSAFGFIVHPVRREAASCMCEGSRRSKYSSRWEMTMARERVPTVNGALCIVGKKAPRRNVLAAASRTNDGACLSADRQTAQMSATQRN
jgi:hypothetical protein